MMTSILSALAGKKTYIIAVVLAGLALADALGYAQFTAPVYGALAALGLTTARVGMIKG